MSYKPYTLTSLINQKNRTLFLPHIQRPFVWEFEQTARFLDSLMKNYPIQTFLFWKTKDEIKCRKFMDDISYDTDLSIFYDKNISEKDKEKVLVLDGQQRLQSLFIIYNGFHEGESIYINLLTGDKEIDNGISYEIKKSSASLSLPFIKIKDLTTNVSNAEDIADDLNQKLDTILTGETQQDRNNRERRVRKNISQLISILREDKHIWIEELDGISSAYFNYETVLDIFIRVNSGGTKLESSDLMFAIMKEEWSGVEENIESIVQMLNSNGKLFFDKNIILKSLSLTSNLGASIKPELFTGKDGDKNLQAIEAKWPTINNAITIVRDFISNDICLYSDKVIRSYNSFIPLIEFSYYKKPDPNDKKKMKAFYYSAQLFNWFSAQTDTILEALHKIIEKNPGAFPLQDLQDYFKKQNKKTSLSLADLEDAKLRYIILNMIYVERLGHSPFNVSYKGNEPHIDHIYPKSKLAASHGSKDINHIGNYRFLGATDNIRKKAQDPSSYFQDLKNSGIEVEKHLLVDDYINDLTKLTYPNYIDFRDKRLVEIFKIAEAIINI